MYRTRSDDPYSDLALGLISAQSFPAIVGIADMMLKSSAVTLVGYEQIGSGYCTAVVRGRTPDIRLAIQTGEELAAQFGQKTSSVIIPRPMPNLEEVLPIGSRLAELVEGRENNRFRDQAVGLIETRGFPALVAAADAMLKSADVTLSAYHTTGAGLCTAIVRGSMSNVAAAIEIGMAEADRVGELHAVMVIPRPLEDLERTMPIAACWIEELQPVRMPINITVEETVRELQPLQPLELPQPQEIPVFNEEVFEPQKLELEQPIEDLRMPDRAAQEPLQEFAVEPFEAESWQAKSFDRGLDAPLESPESPIEPTPTQSPLAKPVVESVVEPVVKPVAELRTEVEAAPVEAVPVEVTPVEVTPVEVTPVKIAPVEVMPRDAAEIDAERLNPPIGDTTPSNPSSSQLPAIDAIAVEFSAVETIAPDLLQLAPEAVSPEAVSETPAQVLSDRSPETSLETAPEFKVVESVPVVEAVPVVESVPVVEAVVEAVEVTVEVVEASPIATPIITQPPIEPPAPEAPSPQNAPAIATNSAETIETIKAVPEGTPSQPESQPLGKSDSKSDSQPDAEVPSAGGSASPNQEKSPTQSSPAAEEPIE